LWIRSCEPVSACAINTDNTDQPAVERLLLLQQMAGVQN
jgi:hypothetical protein